MLPHWTPFNFGFNVLIVFGLWNLDTDDLLKTRLYRFYQVFMWGFFMAFFNITQLIDLYSVLFDLEKINMNCRGTLMTSLCLMASLDSISKFRVITALKKEFEDQENAKMDKDVGKVYLQADREIKSINRFFSFAIYLSLTVWVLSPLRDKNPESIKLPFRQWIPFDLKPLPNYCAAYVFQIISSFYTRSYLLGSGSMILGFMIRIIAQYEIMEEKIKIINQICGVKNNRPFWKVLKEKMILRVIKELVRNHQEILLRIQQLNNAFRIFFFIQLFFFTLLLAIVGVCIILTERNSDILTQIMYMVTMLLYVLLLCSYGTRIIDKSYDIVQAIYDIPWYEMSPRIRKYWVLVLAQAQKPPKIWAGKFFQINFVFYLEMLKRTYEVFMLCRLIIMRNRT